MNPGSVLPVKPGEKNVWSPENIQIKESDPWEQATNVPEGFLGGLRTCTRKTRRRRGRRSRL